MARMMFRSLVFNGAATSLRPASPGIAIRFGCTLPETERLAGISAANMLSKRAFAAAELKDVCAVPVVGAMRLERGTVKADS